MLQPILDGFDQVGGPAWHEGKLTVLFQPAAQLFQRFRSDGGAFDGKPRRAGENKRIRHTAQRT
jgi:hypothetical protein